MSITHSLPDSSSPSPTAPSRWQHLRSNLRRDVPASLVVFLVAVPLSLGIAVASGAPVAAGLIAAVVGGLVAGAVGGAPLQVSGPAAGLTVVVAETIDRFGWEVTCAITVIAGLVQILLGLSRTARTALAISPAVVHGMLAGIGLTIVFAQLHVVLGGQPQSGFVANLTALPGQVLDLHTSAALLGLAVIVVVLLWPKLPGKIKLVPAPLIAIAGTTLVATLAGLSAPRVDLPGSLINALSTPVLPTGDFGAFGVAVLTIALIASVESLVSAVATDRMHAGPRANLNRELIGQGSANAVSGMIGGLPVTGVIVRSTTNISFGARTRTSAILHGVWVLLFSVLLFGVVELIPLAALAALLVTVGAKLVNPGHVKAMYRHGELLVYVITVAGVVLLNLLEGVLIGLAVALLITLHRVMISSVRLEQPETAENTDGAAGPWRLTVRGRFSFLSVPRLAFELGRVPAKADVVMELITDYVDHAAHEYVQGWVERHRAAGGTVWVDEIGEAGLDASAGPSRKAQPAQLPRWMMPWNHWQRLDAAAAPRAVMLNGLKEYERRSRGQVQPFLSELADGQHPRAMWITCADSRVVPNVITSSGPGDLFTVRNIGNLVPSGRLGDDADVDTSVSAALEYGIGALEIPMIVVCGHSGCGAMRAVLDGDEHPGALGSWLHQASSSLERWRDGDGVAADRCEADQLAMINVSEQVGRLHRHPVVAAAVADGRAQVVGAFFDIASGQVLILDEDSGRFRPVGSEAMVPLS